MDRDLASMRDRVLGEVSPPPRLRAHLAIVEEVAGEIAGALRRLYPALAFDADAVEFGAATHDLGKALHPDELTGPGSLHEAAGEGLLIGRGVPPGLARFCRTHGSWRTDPAAGLEDLLVALADTCWKGKRDMDLEIRVSRAAAGGMGGDPWAVLAELDGILEALAARAEERLARQGREG